VPSSVSAKFTELVDTRVAAEALDDGIRLSPETTRRIVVVFIISVIVSNC